MIVVQGIVIHNDMQTLYESLTNVSKHIKPRINQSQPVNVDVMFAMNTIQDYDEISGNLVFTASFAFFWKDEFKMWNPLNFSGIINTQLPIMKTWVPALVLRNGVNQNSLFTFSNMMDIETTMVTYTADGDALLNIFGQYQITCDSDVTRYPYDEHWCIISVWTPDVLSGMTLSSVRGMVFGASIGNAEWAIPLTFVNVYHRNQTLHLMGFNLTADEIEFSFTIKREYLFPFLNIILPIIILMFSHCLVFFLPVVSGERTSFSFTLLLTFVVYMTAALEQLPPSNNISIFNIFLFHQFVFSIHITILVVFSIQIFYKDKDSINCGAPFKVILFLYHCSCKICFRKKRIVDGCTSHQTVYDTKENHSWKKVSVFFDQLCLFYFFVSCVVQLSVYGLVVPNL